MGEPRARRTLFAASRAAVVDLWGDAGLEQVATHLADDARRAVIEPVVMTAEWLPERYMIAWYGAVWRGPARRLVQEFRRFIDARMGHGFDRVRRAAIASWTPAELVAKAPALWRHDHTSGELTATQLAAAAVSVTLRDHPYTRSNVACMATADVYRHAVSLLGTVRSVVAAYEDPKGDALVVRLSWQSAG